VSYSIELADQAIHDLSEIMDWYRHQKEGLEIEFKLSLEAAFDQLKRNPLAFQIRVKGSRNILLQRFPYKVVFKIYSERIKIYGVLHHSRSPKLIRKRLK